MSDRHLLTTLETVIRTQSSAYGGPSTERCENAWRILRRLSRHNNTDADEVIERVQADGFDLRDGDEVRPGASP